MSSTVYPSGGPDLRHPSGYRKAEAVWKRLISKEHAKFCDCGTYINHFRWPGSGGEEDGRTEEDGTKHGDGGDHIVSAIGATGGGGDGDLSDIELLR
nr:ORF2 [Torque teno Leptonychotes weddellii virus 2]